MIQVFIYYNRPPVFEMKDTILTMKKKKPFTNEHIFYTMTKNPSGFSTKYVNRRMKP